MSFPKDQEGRKNSVEYCSFVSSLFMKHRAGNMTFSAYVTCSI